MSGTERMDNLIVQVESFLENYDDGAELKLYISPGEKKNLEDYVHHHPKGGKNFYFRPGICKPGHLERDFRLSKKKI